MMDTALVYKEPRKALIIAAFAAIYVIWGSTYIAMLLAIKSIPPFLMIGIRFVIAGLLLYFFARFRGEKLPDRSSMGKLSVSGILMLFLGTGAVAWVEQYIESGLAAIIVASVPLWFVLLDKRQWKYNFSNKWILVGLAIGFIGVLTLVADGKTFSLSGDRMKLISLFVMIGGTITWTVGSLFLKYQPAEGSAGMKAAVQMFAAGVSSSIAGLLMGEHHQADWNAVSMSSIAALLYLIVFGSLIGYMAYVWLLSVRPASIVGTYAYVNPVVAVYLGWIIMNEPITLQRMIALVIILSGVILVTLTKKKT
jgi:drug/metabolite transporter (DMT)-like permease